MAKVKETKIDAFKPQERNANRHSQRGLGSLESSMRKHGYVAPMTAAADGEIIDGSARLETVANVFDDDVLVVEHDGTKPIVMVRTDIPSADSPEAREISIAANRIAELNLTWDAEVLLEDLQSGVDLKGLFNQDELDALLDGLIEKAPMQPAGENVTEAEAEKLAKQYGTKPGQVWQLGRHKIACVDCTNEDEVRRIVGDLDVKYVWSDPPYGISIVATNVSVGGGEAYDIPFGGRKKAKGNVGGGESIKASPGLYPIQMRNKKGFGSSNGAKPFGASAVRGSIGAANMIDVGKYAPVIGDETTETAIKSSDLYLSLYPDALHVWWGANYYANALPPSSCWIVWDKENTGNFADAELAWCSSPTAVRIFKHMWNGLMKDSEKGQRRVHPTQKPIELARWAFEKYGKPNDVIVDPFLGSGISVLAAEQLNDGRTVIGFELSHEYIAATIHRWATMTGQTPVLL